MGRRLRVDPNRVLGEADKRTVGTLCRLSELALPTNEKAWLCWLCDCRFIVIGRLLAGPLNPPLKPVMGRSETNQRLPTPFSFLTIIHFANTSIVSPEWLLPDDYPFCQY